MQRSPLRYLVLSPSSRHSGPLHSVPALERLEQRLMPASILVKSVAAATVASPAASAANLPSVATLTPQEMTSLFGVAIALYESVYVNTFARRVGGLGGQTPSMNATRMSVPALALAIPSFSRTQQTEKLAGGGDSPTGDDPLNESQDQDTSTRTAPSTAVASISVFQLPDEAFLVCRAPGSSVW
jgi:hypothetical protein